MIPLVFPLYWQNCLCLGREGARKGGRRRRRRGRGEEIWGRGSNKCPYSKIKVPLLKNKSAPTGILGGKAFKKGSNGTFRSILKPLKSDQLPLLICFLSQALAGRGRGRRGGMGEEERGKHVSPTKLTVFRGRGRGGNEGEERGGGERGGKGGRRKKVRRAR